MAQPPPPEESRTMIRPVDQQLIDIWKERPAPLLPVLHAFHDRDGYLSEEAIRAVAKGLRIPVADLFGTVTFYHHFARNGGGLDAPRVCTGPVCRMNGALDLLADLDGAVPMPCSGRCDQPVPVLRGHETLVGRAAADLV
ncbi:MAG TPA: NAD(P)H-dependent oxidoreductase subunit E, partial [Longimicrobiales bacterium]